MLAELFESDHRQEARPRPAARNDVERRRRLADLLAVPAGELLPHGLDHFPLARNRLQGLGHVLAELAQPRAAAAGAGCRRLDHHALARQMLGEGVARRPLALKPATVVVLATACSAASSSSVALASSSSSCKRQLIDQPRRALRVLPVDLALQLGDLQAFAAAISAMSSDALARATASSAFSAAFSSKKGFARRRP